MYRGRKTELPGGKVSACGLNAEVQMLEYNPAGSFQYGSAKKEGDTNCVWFLVRGRKFHTLARNRKMS